MKRLLLVGFATVAFALAPTHYASAKPKATKETHGGSDGAVIQVGGHGHGWGHHGGRGHHYGWGRGRGHHYGWARGRHYGWM